MTAKANPQTEKSARVLLKIEQQIAWVQLNRANKRNALDLAMFEAIRDCQKLIAKDQSIRAVIVAGNGEDFCSGLDIKAVMSNKWNAIKLLWKWLPGNANLAQKVSVGWRRLKVPVIVAIHGRCWGGGMQIALGADFRIASPSSSLSIMETKWGLIPDMAGNLALRDCMSKDQAMKLSMTAEEISSQQALELNLITEISEQPVAAAKQLAEQIKQQSPDAIKAIKKLFHKRWQDFDRYILASETLSQWRILLGKNQTIAVKRQSGKNIEYK
ncbi:crotonase/enoyl-CoA hydratase family protein [Kangiella sp. HZ709]|uniref:crotonase/enoyl-CoA hydratase family protein n=1 Tax=Kangiella sp. HZ709 TaxID=2666328 RepID=UPI0012B11803|nr:crotonase/enoyl-CoA hydratase family protein [Kangiella sp. HZ709]MRX27106.1 crotonase/enoyl-CoA hydratase family protein [Kangiella sp. HZ709]